MLLNASSGEYAARVACDCAGTWDDDRSWDTDDGSWGTGDGWL